MRSGYLVGFRDRPPLAPSAPRGRGTGQGHSDCLRKRLAFQFKNAGGESFRGVCGQDGATELEDRGTGVELVVDVVNRAARFGVLGFQHSFVDVVAVHSFAAMLGEEGRVNIEDAMVVGGWDFEQLEIACEDNEVDVVFAEQGFERVGWDDARDDFDEEASLATALNASSGVAAADDERDGCVEFASLDGVKEIEYGASAAGDEAGEARRVRCFCGRGHW